MCRLPEDPLLLLSMINMKLRDFYPDMNALCEDLNADRGRIDKILSDAGYVYNEKDNRYE